MRISDWSSDVCSSDLGAITVSGADGAGSASALDAGAELAIASYGTGALNISDGGAVSVGSKAYIGFYADSTGTLTIGAADDEAAAGSGSFVAAPLGFRAGDGTLVFNHRARTEEHTAELQSL